MHNIFVKTNISKIQTPHFAVYWGERKTHRKVRDNIYYILLSKCGNWLNKKINRKVRKRKVQGSCVPWYTYVPSYIY